MKTIYLWGLTATLALAACSPKHSDDIKVEAIPYKSPAPSVSTTNDKDAFRKDSLAQLAAASYDSDMQKEALSGFITGTEFCEKFKDITSKENGFYVTVPVDYKDASKGQTQIWTYLTSGAFNPALPTVIFFDGGSGGNSHGWGKILKNFNEVHYDQRGIGCSHPQSLALYRDPNFYSNENNARDADEIRKALKIDKISVYGGSYGTVVATVYASIFASNTTAAVLDGTVFNHEENYKVLRFYLKRAYNQLPDGTKIGLKKYINQTSQIVSLWSLARVLMYSNNPFDKLKTYLMMAFPSENEINQEIADKLFGANLFNDTFFGETVDAVEAFNNQMLNCKNSPQKAPMDLTLFGPIGDTYYELEKYENKIDRTAECAAIGAKDDKIYAATDYPLTVPTTYFQGNLDGATFADGAVKHYKQVAKGSKQIMIAVGGGHCPGLVALNQKNLGMVEIAEAALRGEKVNQDQREVLNLGQKEVKWVYAEKN